MKKKKTIKPPSIKKNKLKSLPNKPVPLGGSPFVGRSTTG